MSKKVIMTGIIALVAIAIAVRVPQVRAIVLGG